MSVTRLALLAVLLYGGAALGQNAGMPQGEPADNTKMNQRDRNSAEATADQQKENSSDRQLTQQIRRSLVQDKSLSTYAHNVKIVTQNGNVTLKGPVKSEVEKAAIEQKAAEAAGGADKVRSELQVKTDNNGKPSANQ